MLPLEQYSKYGRFHRYAKPRLYNLLSLETIAVFIIIYIYSLKDYLRIYGISNFVNGGTQIPR